MDNALTSTNQSSRDVSSLKDSKSFCILPWMHVRLNQDGEVYPCCRQAELSSYGSLKEKNFSEIWNGKAIREMRKKLMAGEKLPACESCYHTERCGSKSYRQAMNETFADAFERVKGTSPDGWHRDESLLSLDLRLSNNCNFRCRSCGPQNSVAWYADSAAITGTRWQGMVRPMAKKNLMVLLDKWLPDLRVLYFAGGEPLLEEEHYELLALLIERGRTDIHLDYNTNFSTLRRGPWNALEMWKHFKRVTVGASLDGVGEQGELLRKGMRWPEIEANFQKLRTQAPHVQFFIYCTVTAMNAFHLPVAFERFLQAGMVTKPEQLALNIASEPAYMGLGIFTEQEQILLKRRYAKFIANLRAGLHRAVSPELTKHFETELNRVIDQLPSKFNLHDRRRFRQYTLALDRTRKESTILAFPELFNAITAAD